MKPLPKFPDPPKPSDAKALVDGAPDVLTAFTRHTEAAKTIRNATERAATLTAQADALDEDRRGGLVQVAQGEAAAVRRDGELAREIQAARDEASALRRAVAGPVGDELATAAEAYRLAAEAAGPHVAAILEAEARDVGAVAAQIETQARLWREAERAFDVAADTALHHGVRLTDREDLVGTIDEIRARILAPGPREFFDYATIATDLAALETLFERVRVDAKSCRCTLNPKNGVWKFNLAGRAVVGAREALDVFAGETRRRASEGRAGANRKSLTAVLEPVASSTWAL